MRILGIDVSHWEGQIYWPEASRYLGFAYFKCTDGINFVDPTFEANQAGLQAAGLAHAPFHYYQPAHDPGAQADHFIKTAGKDYKRYIVDVEEPAGRNELVEGVDQSLPSSLLSFLLRCTQLTGVKPAIYTSPGYWDEFVKPLPGWSHEYDLVVAHYTAEHLPDLPIGWNHWTIWQFSDFFFVPGCSCEVDGDWFNGTMDQCRWYFGNYRQVDPVVYSFKARSLFDKLHVRAEPSRLSKELAHLMKGDEVIIQQLAGQDVWVRHAGGWSCIEQAGYRYMEVLA